MEGYNSKTTLEPLLHRMDLSWEEAITLEHPFKPWHSIQFATPWSILKFRNNLISVRVFEGWVCVEWSRELCRIFVNLNHTRKKKVCPDFLIFAGFFYLKIQIQKVSFPPPSWGFLELGKNLFNQNRWLALLIDQRFDHNTYSGSYTQPIRRHSAEWGPGFFLIFIGHNTNLGNDSLCVFLILFKGILKFTLLISQNFCLFSPANPFNDSTPSPTYYPPPQCGPKLFPPIRVFSHVLDKRFNLGKDTKFLQIIFFFSFKTNSQKQALSDPLNKKNAFHGLTSWYQVDFVWPYFIVSGLWVDFWYFGCLFVCPKILGFILKKYSLFSNS